MSEADVREAFARQAAICTAAGAPFTGQVCALIGQRLDRTTATGQRVLDWQGVPSHDGDALPLRLAGGLHSLARSGLDADLGALYPPQPRAGDDAVWKAVRDAIAAHGGRLGPWLAGPPQTNEVGRSAGLMAGLLVLAARHRLPFALHELGASAGLNTALDRYGFRLGETRAGNPASAVQMVPYWQGASPPEAAVRIVRRAGVDHHPLDISYPATRERLSAYVWADQRSRLVRLTAALDLVALDPPRIERDDAAAWLERTLAVEPEPGVCRVVMHTIAFQYFSDDSQSRIEQRMSDAGARATYRAPLAWLSYEVETGGLERRPVLRLRSWPGGDDRILATGHPHGADYDWLGDL